MNNQNPVYALLVNMGLRGLYQAPENTAIYEIPYRVLADGSELYALDTEGVMIQLREMHELGVRHIAVNLFHSAHSELMLKHLYELVNNQGMQLLNSYEMEWRYRDFEWPKLSIQYQNRSITLDGLEHDWQQFESEWPLVLSYVQTQGQSSIRFLCLKECEIKLPADARGRILSADHQRLRLIKDDWQNSWIRLQPQEQLCLYLSFISSTSSFTPD